MKRTLYALTAAIAMIGALCPLSSCDSVIYDDEGDCSVRYHVPFTFTRNILNSDAFATQVTSVTLYVFDKEGHLVLTKSESGSPLAAPGYRMDVDLAPGTYDMLAWCTGTSPVADPTAFVIGTGSAPAAYSATLPLKGEAGAEYCNQDITPLYHGWITDVVCGADDYSDVDLPAIDLTKDTNLINVILYNRDGREMVPSDFSIRIAADNSHLDYRNNPVGTAAFDYRPWSLNSLQTSSGTDDNSRADETATGYTGLMAELTTGRLMADRRPRLTVTRNDDGEDVISLDLISTFLAVKSHYDAQYSDQDYLDRMDRYSLIFVMSDDLSWYTADGININGWTIVPPQDMPL